ncbi:unnamed protein product, partial [Hapterophycus canaliculatus]
AIKETCHWFDEDFGHSNTSLEMMYGAFHANPECKRSALFYFRQQSPKHSTVGQEEDEADQLEQLKQVLRSENLRLRPYRTPNDLAEQLLEDVSKLLETMYPKDGGDELESTWRQQVLFRQNCMASYVRRLELDIALAQTLAECKRVLVFGGKGVGKTFVLANWASTHSSPSAIAPRRQIA